MENECSCGEYHDLKCPVAKALRNCWCTPKWLAELIGAVDLDPCSNSRSHIVASARCISEERDIDDGLAFEPGYCRWATGQTRVWRNWRVFINPPYGSGQVIRWVRHYRHTRFIYLLRWDPSTEWFAELLPECDYVWFPDCRIDFEPPPRIHESSNPYPHALFLRDPPDDLIQRLKTKGFLFRVDAEFIRAYLEGHGRDEKGSPSSRKRGGESRRKRDGGSSKEGASGDRSGDVHGPGWTNPNPEATKAHYRREAERQRGTKATRAPTKEPAR